MARRIILDVVHHEHVLLLDGCLEGNETQYVPDMWQWFVGGRCYLKDESGPKEAGVEARRPE